MKKKLCNNFYMYMKNGRNDEIEIYQNFDFHFHIGKNTVFVFRARLICMGKSLFVHTYIEPVHFRSYAMTFSRMVPPT